MDTSEPAVNARASTIADTAFSIAAIRAEESELFDDPYAKHFAAAGAHAAEATQRYLDLPFFKEGVRLRTRFIDDYVRDALAAGLSQVVILGAGFDMRALRIPEIAERAIPTYEIDVPDQLARKREILARAGVRIPAHVRYVPCDFDKRDIAGALSDTDFRAGEGAVFVWEGVIGYIDKTAIEASLRFMATAGGAGTRVVFTSGPNTFDPETSTECAARCGFSSCEELGLDEAWRRYWKSEPYEYAHVSKVCDARV